MEAAQVQAMRIQIVVARDLTINPEILLNRHLLLQERPPLPHHRPPQKAGEMKDSQARMEKEAPTADVDRTPVQIQLIRQQLRHLRPQKEVGEMKGSLECIRGGAQVVVNAGTLNL